MKSKKVFPALLLLVALAAPLATAAQGRWVKKYEARRILKLLVGNRFVWAVGEGTIAMTPNRGATWLNSLEDSTMTICDIQFVDFQNGWAVGEPNVVMYTTNGGRQWHQLRDTDPASFETVYFRIKTTGWVGGSGGRLMFTDSTGQAWATQNLQLTADQAADSAVHQILFLTAQNGLLLIGEGRAVLTRDGGAEWFPLGFPPSIKFEAIARQGETVWLAGDRQLTPALKVASLWRSHDLGQTWQPLASVKKLSGTITSLWFADALTGYLAADGKVYRTQDGGESWEEFSDGVVAIEKIYGSNVKNLWGLTPEGAVYQHAAAAEPEPEPAAPSP